MDTRMATYGDVSTALALLSDDKLGRRVAAASDTGSGVGGTSALLNSAISSASRVRA